MAAAKYFTVLALTFLAIANMTCADDSHVSGDVTSTGKKDVGASVNDVPKTPTRGVTDTSSTNTVDSDAVSTTVRRRRGRWGKNKNRKNKNKKNKNKKNKNKKNKNKGSKNKKGKKKSVKINGKRLPTTCNCKKGPKGEGSCYYYTEINSNYCDVRYCAPQYVCVGNRRTGTTCILRRVSSKIVPDGEYTCKTKKVNSYMYVPYAEYK